MSNAKNTQTEKAAATETPGAARSPPAAASPIHPHTTRRAVLRVLVMPYVFLV